MIILNFAHPLTDEQLDQVRGLSGEEITQVIDIPSQVDTHAPLAPQVRGWIENLGVEPQRWQSEKWLINPPALNFSAVVLLAELHGRLDTSRRACACARSGMRWCRALRWPKS